MDRKTATPSVDSLPGETARRWVDWHTAHAAPGEHAHEFVWDLQGDAEGPFVTDVDGNVLLDFTCHIGAAPLGYNNPKVLDPMREFDLVDPLKIAGQDFYFGSGDPDDPDFPGVTDLMARLTDASSHYDIDTVFLSNSGAEAIENAMKAAYASTDRGKYGFAFEGGFHGRTLGSLSVTAAKPVYTRDYPELAGVRTLPFCTHDRPDGENCDCGFFAGGTSALRRTLDPDHGHIAPDEVAFVVLEPVQGVGGYRVPGEEFMAEVGAVCETFDVPLIVDEVQSGVGRTGEFWASDHFDIEPDVIAAGKALRVGATVARREVFPGKKNRLGSTWGGGDILGAMAGAFTLDAITDHELLANATERGRQFREIFRDANPVGVEDVRGLGLMLAVEFVSKARRDAVVAEAVERGLLLLGCGHATVRVLPPLDATAREIELGAGILLDAIQAV